jgi:hypothetical protein
MRPLRWLVSAEGPARRSALKTGPASRRLYGTDAVAPANRRAGRVFGAVRRQGEADLAAVAACGAVLTTYATRSMGVAASGALMPPKARSKFVMSRKRPWLVLIQFNP